MEPYLILERQIKEPTAMIDEPLAEIKAFTDRMEEERKAQRRAEIKQYYDTVSAPLGELADLLFESEAFIDKKWLNASTKPKVWQDGVREKVAQASADLSTIQQTGGSQTPALIDRYMESMDMAATKAYQKSLQQTEAAAAFQTGKPHSVGGQLRLQSALSFLSELRDLLVTGSYALRRPGGAGDAGTDR